MKALSFEVLPLLMTMVLLVHASPLVERQRDGNLTRYRRPLHSPLFTEDAHSPTETRTTSVAVSSTIPSSSANRAPSLSAVPSADTPSLPSIAQLKAAYNKTKTIDFSILDSASKLTDHGFTINSGWSIGPVAPDGTTCYGDPGNVAIKNGILEMTVPGGQAAGGKTSGAEIQFGKEGMTGGVFEMVAMVDGSAGTCQSMFTYHTGEALGEQDIEILGQVIYDSGYAGTPPGIELTNWSPIEAGFKTSSIVPFPSDPTQGYHTYTIAWVEGGTRYFYDGEELKAPSGYSSINPSELIINHWTNGDPAFTAGPPGQDVIMKVKSVDFHYASD